MVSRNNFRRVNTGYHALNTHNSSIPPVKGLLLSPAVLGLAHGIFHRGGANAHAILLEQNRFGTGGTQVNTKHVFHNNFLFSI